MSQAKVDRYKKEKKNREKNLKKKKILKAVWIVVFAIIIGACIGIPVGKKIYKVNAEKRKANETVAAEYYNVWLTNYWNANYSGKYNFEGQAVDSLINAIEGATPTDAN